MTLIIRGLLDRGEQKISKATAVTISGTISGWLIMT